jgi:hypothetical protein
VHAAVLSPPSVFDDLQARLNVHCYEVRDFEAMLRVADEFGFRVSAFHHALEAWVAPELFRERNITIATFVDLWGYKVYADRPQKGEGERERRLVI